MQWYHDKTDAYFTCATLDQIALMKSFEWSKAIRTCQFSGPFSNLVAHLVAPQNPSLLIVLPEHRGSSSQKIKDVKNEPADRLSKSVNLAVKDLRQNEESGKIPDH